MAAVRLEPLGVTVDAVPGTALADLLFRHGVEFPCGGKGRCRGCRITVQYGHLAETAEDLAALSPADRAAGQRLACRATVAGDLTVMLSRMEAPILADDSHFAFTPREGFGIAVDIGTTTMVAQLVDLHDGSVHCVRTALNPQARHGADLISRMEYDLHGGAGALRGLVRTAVGDMVDGLAAGRPLARVVLVGNTVMHHLFCGIDCAALALHPFEPLEPGERRFTGGELGWATAVPEVVFLPCLGGLVGSDLLAGILATRMDQADGINVLLDLGTNGEVVVGGREGLLCTSTAAGPAFEGARIAQGMRAATGAISAVEREKDSWRCRVIGGGAARGICGSGLVDAVAVMLDLGLVRENGRFAAGVERLALTLDVALVQRDIRELQLAKGAVAAGMQTLVALAGAREDTIAGVHLAGAFGNYISRRSARRIGLLSFPPARVQPAGNTALLGAKLALFADDLAFPGIRRQVRHVSLRSDPDFADRFVDGMGFPGPDRDAPVQPVAAGAATVP